MPLDYFDVSPRERALLAYEQASQTMAIYTRKASLLAGTMTRYRPFTKHENVQTKLREVEALIAAEQYEKAVKACGATLSSLVQGLTYVDMYHNGLLKCAAPLIYMGYMGTIFLALTEGPLVDEAAPGSMCQAGIVLGVLFLVGVTMAYTHLECLPPRAWLYLWVPIPLAGHLILSILARWRIRRLEPPPRGSMGGQSLLVGSVSSLGRKELGWDLLTGGLCLVAVQVVVCSFFYRATLTAFWVALATIGSARLSQGLLPRDIALPAIASCLGCALFPLLPVDMDERDWMVVLGAGGVVLLVALRRHAQGRGALAIAFADQDLVFQCSLLAVGTVVMLHTASSLRAMKGLPGLNKMITWGITGAALTYPFLIDRKSSGVVASAESAFLGFSVPLVMLSLAYEVLYYCVLGALCFSWYRIEIWARSSGTHERTLGGGRVTRQDIVTACMVFVLTHAAFFGTGNIASVSHFELSSVYRYTTIFSPLLMGSLLFLKIWLPIGMVGCTFNAILKVNQVPPIPIYLVLIAIAELGVLHFFFHVRNTGSWLQIGNSISHFAIASLTVVWIPVAFLLSSLYMGSSQPRDDSHIARGPPQGVGIHNSLASSINIGIETGFSDALRPVDVGSPVYGSPLRDFDE